MIKKIVKKEADLQKDKDFLVKKMNKLNITGDIN
jgi:hypothetical protein